MKKIEFESEERFIEFLIDIHDNVSEDYLKISVRRAKEKGYIKKSELEIAKDEYRNMKGVRLSPDVGINDMISCADGVIEEQDKEIQRLKQRLSE